MKYGSLRNLILKLHKRTGIQKKITPHLLRHSRASFLADHLTDSQMNNYFGWVQGSKMSSTYVHMNGKKTESSLLALNGIEQPQKVQESKLKPRICQRCDTINAFDSKFCRKCAGILEIKTAMELQEKTAVENQERSIADNMMGMLMKDPEIKELLMRKVKELGIEETT